MRSTEDSLFRLVQSMTLAERGQFKKAQKDSSANFVQLLDIIQNMPEYDKVQFRKSAEKKLGAKSFSGAKNYLYKALLDFLYEYDKSNSIQGQIQILTDRTKVLFNKGLFEECNGMLEEAKKIAGHHESFVTLIELSDIELNLRSRLEKTDTQYFNGIFKQKEELLHKKKMQDQYRKIFFDMHILFEKAQTSPSLSPEMLAQAKEVMESPLMKEYPNDNAPFYCQYTYLSIQHMYRCIGGNNTKEMAHLEQWIDLWISKPHMKGKYLFAFFAALIEYLEEGFKRKNFTRFTELIPHTETEYKIINSLTYSHDVSKYLLIKSRIALYQGNLEPAILVVKQMLNMIKNHKMPAIYFEWYLITQMQAAILHLLAKEFKTASRHLNWIINNCTEKNADILFKAKILRMMVADDDQEYFYMGELVNTAEKYGVRYNRQHAIEKTFIAYFKKISRSNTTDERIEYLKELKHHLSNKFETTTLEDYFLFDPLIWIDSKLNEKPTMDIFKEKALKNYPEIFTIKI